MLLLFKVLDEGAASSRNAVAKFHIAVHTILHLHALRMRLLRQLSLPLGLCHHSLRKVWRTAATCARGSATSLSRASCRLVLLLLMLLMLAIRGRILTSRLLTHARRLLLVLLLRLIIARGILSSRLSRRGRGRRRAIRIVDRVRFQRTSLLEVRLIPLRFSSTWRCLILLHVHRHRSGVRARRSIRLLRGTWRRRGNLLFLLLRWCRLFRSTRAHCVGFNSASETVRFGGRLASLDFNSNWQTTPHAHVIL